MDKRRLTCPCSTMSWIDGWSLMGPPAPCRHTQTQTWVIYLTPWERCDTAQCENTLSNRVNKSFPTTSTFTIHSRFAYSMNPSVFSWMEFPSTYSVQQYKRSAASCRFIHPLPPNCNCLKSFRNMLACFNKILYLLFIGTYPFIS